MTTQNSITLALLVPVAQYGTRAAPTTRQFPVSCIVLELARGSLPTQPNLTRAHVTQPLMRSFFRVVEWPWLPH